MAIDVHEIASDAVRLQIGTVKMVATRFARLRRARDRHNG
jgi:hypothetical protein